MSDAFRQKIGPGQFVAVVGPSGAGKDTLLGAAQARLADDPAYLFPRRIVTRPPSAAEANEEVDPERFARLAQEGAFSITWAAHGLSYGLPIAVEAAVEDGRTVICNVSRSVLADLRDRFAQVTTVEVTAPPDILARRLASRGRTTDGDPGSRLRRANAYEGTEADVVIENAGDVATAAEAFLAALARVRQR